MSYAFKLISIERRKLHMIQLHYQAFYEQILREASTTNEV